MGVNLTLDEKVVEEARRLTGLDDDRAAVEQVVQIVLAAWSRNKDLASLVGKVKFYDGYDPRTLRS